MLVFTDPVSKNVNKPLRYLYYMSMKVRIPVQRVLFARSGGRCAKCRTAVTQDDATSVTPIAIGIVAHIAGKKPESARYDKKMTIDERRSYNNLIILCSNCHTLVDKQVKFYSVKKLHKMKEDHEKWVTRTLKENIPNITFIELESVIKYLVSGQDVSDTSYRLIPPGEKISKNGLSSITEGMIKMGLSRVKEVEQYINSHPDLQFGQQLKTGFLNEYMNQRNDGLVGDDLFISLVQFAGHGSDPARWSAGLVVLVYLFEKCEVFER